MRVVADPSAVQREALARRARGERIGFVPTMGFLHAGHTSLMALARQHCDWLVVSIYVNPLQFGTGEDLDRYPRDPDGDAEKCRDSGVDCILAPQQLYARGHATTVAVDRLTAGLCGAKRPGHFAGVTTVVARLFGIVQPHVAVFGEKDYQQLAVVRRMVQDLSMPVEVMGGPLVRDTDGLALSSRNKFLTSEQRDRALSLHRALFAVREAAALGEIDVATLRGLGSAAIDADQIDYLEIVDAESLDPLADVDRPARALAAAFYGGTRLIDNVAVVAGPAMRRR